MKYFKKILPNGLTILTVPSRDAESVVVDFFVKTGSRFETPKENGISHFLEHFLFKGTQKYPTALAISQLIDGIGGEMNANTGKEHTQYYIKAHHRHLPLIFEVLTDMLQYPLFNEAELEREKGVIVEEINMYKDTPMYDIGNRLEKMMWPKDRLGADIAGSKETVTKFTPIMFRDYMSRYYQPENMIIGISGKFNEKSLESLVKKYWLNVKKHKYGSFERAKDKQNSLRVGIHRKVTEQAHLALGFKGLSYTDKRNPIASVLSAVLGGGMSSRLFTEVREKRGLAYYVRASSSNYLDTGAFEVYAGVRTDKLEEALEAISHELARVKREKVDPQELMKAKEYIKGRTTLALEDNSNQLEWYLDKIAFEKQVESPDQFFSKLDKVTASDVQKLASYLFEQKRTSVAVIGPHDGEKTVRKIIQKHL